MYVKENGALSFSVSKGKSIFLYLTDMQLKYWKYENKAICYLIIDCFIALAYENNASVKNMIDSVPINHVNVFEMQKRAIHYIQEKNILVYVKMDIYIN